jgi:hypothetical protein
MFLRYILSWRTSARFFAARARSGLNRIAPAPSLSFTMVQAAPAIAWVIGDSEPPDGLRTTEFYEALIKHCSTDGCATMAALGATIASKFLAPTVADHKSNVTYEALRQLLSELGLPCDAEYPRQAHAARPRLRRRAPADQSWG